MQAEANFFTKALSLHTSKQQMEDGCTAQPVASFTFGKQNSSASVQLLEQSTPAAIAALFQLL